MNKEEIKFNTNEDIIMQIEMDSYMKYNGTIASMNAHLGEIYGYSDVEDVKNAQTHYEKELAYEAIEQLQQENNQLKEEIVVISRLYEMREQEKVIVMNKTVKEIYEEFLNEIIEICKKYNLSISHEDCQGAFQIVKYDDFYTRWLLEAKLVNEDE